MSNISFYAPAQNSYKKTDEFKNGSRLLLTHEDTGGEPCDSCGIYPPSGGSSSIVRGNVRHLLSCRKQQVLVNNQVQLRFLNPGDYDIVKKLCEDWFPVEYPAYWFEAITTDTNLFSLAAILDGRIIGTRSFLSGTGN